MKRIDQIMARDIAVADKITQLRRIERDATQEIEREEFSIKELRAEAEKRKKK